jgi:16S rRNA (guanine527-N7)-methyltransferase
MNNLETFRADLQELKLALNDSQLKQFEQYGELLLSANKSVNLTSITSPDDIYKKHFIDSLALLAFININWNESGGASPAPTKNIIDVGSGAGFPGIPLKIAAPHLQLTLLDSSQKRVAFLENVISQLGLEDTAALHGRAEDLARQAIHREQYDFCVARAVAPLTVLCEYCLPFVKLDGLFVAYKTEDSDEITAAENAISILGGEIIQQTSYKLPNSEISRTLISIKKMSPTPDKYPRRAGMAKKKPL